MTFAPPASAASFDPKEIISPENNPTLSVHTHTPSSLSTPKPEATEWLSGTTATFTLHSGNEGNEVWNTFTSDFTVANFGTFVRLDHGQSISEWKLGRPTSTNARLAAGELETKIWATGVGISVSVPAGASGNIFEQTVTYKATVPQHLYVIDNYGGLEFAGPLLTINQNVTGSWTEGSTTYRWTTN